MEKETNPRNPKACEALGDDIAAPVGKEELRAYMESIPPRELALELFGEERIRRLQRESEPAPDAPRKKPRANPWYGFLKKPPSGARQEAPLKRDEQPRQMPDPDQRREHLEAMPPDQLALELFGRERMEQLCRKDGPQDP